MLNKNKNGMSPKLVARLKEQEADKMRTLLLQLETHAERLEAWEGSEAARVAIANSMERLLDAVEMLEAESANILDEKESAQ